MNSYFEYACKIHNACNNNLLSATSKIESLTFEYDQILT
jgi:hypothetical protein